MTRTAPMFGGLTGDLILDDAFTLLMGLARIGATIALLPGLGETSIPSVVKAGLVLTLTLLLLPSIAPLLPPRPDSELALGSMIAAEMADGLWFGWLARVVTSSLPLAGQFIADVAGFSNIVMPSPDLGAQTSAITRLYEVAVPVLMLTTGLYQVPLAALAGYYRVIPPGTLFWAGDSAVVTIAAIAGSFELALRLAAPFILAGVGWNVAIGLIARLVPRMQIFFVAMPGQMVAGLFLLAWMSGPLLAGWLTAVRAGLDALPGGH